MPSIYLNDTPIEALGLTLVDGAPALGGFRLARDRQPWTGRTGAIPAPFGTTEPAVLTFVADVAASSVAARTAALDALSDALTGLVEIRFEDQASRVMRGVPRVFVADIPAPPRWVNIAPRVTVEIECFNAQKWDAQPTALVLGTTPTPIPCGTLPHGGRLYLTGAAGGALSTETRLRYRGVSGVLLGELVISPSLLAGEFLTINLDGQELVRTTTAGVESNVYAWKTGGTYPRVYPRDGVRAVDAWPTLELTNGAGLYLYRRLWRAPA